MFIWHAQASLISSGFCREATAVVEPHGLRGAAGRLNNRLFAISYLLFMNSCLSKKERACVREREKAEGFSEHFL